LLTIQQRYGIKYLAPDRPSLRLVFTAALDVEKKSLPTVVIHSRLKIITSTHSFKALCSGA
jgi:hypothetical protein